MSEEEKTTESRQTELEQESGELLESLQRLQAEFENYKKRTAREQTQFREVATEGIIKELLPIIDNFTLAISNKPSDVESEFAKGIELTFAELMDVLKKHGVEKIEAKGQNFDPLQHEALMTKPGTKDEVLEVMQEGYVMREKVLRAAKVIVGKGEKGE